MTPNEPFAQLLDALEQPRDDLLTCEECEEQLPAYLYAVQQAEHNEEQWQILRHHLQLCPHCQGEYAALREMMATLYDEKDTVAVNSAEPLVDFLQQTNVGPQHHSEQWHLDAFGNLLITWSAELIRQWQQRVVPLSSPMGLKADKSMESLLFEAQLLNQGPDRAIHIRVIQSPTEPTLCSIEITVDWQDREPLAMAGTKVTLRRRDGQTSDEYALGDSLATLPTDGFGTVIFQGIEVKDLANLQVEIGSENAS